MSTEKNIPEPEAFTSQIEETIEDLFKPSKKIEIDPLTQEIKEIDSDGLNLELEPEDHKIPSDAQFEEKKPAPTIPPISEETHEAEPEIELEPEVDGKGPEEHAIPELEEEHEIVPEPTPQKIDFIKASQAEQEPGIKEEAQSTVESKSLQKLEALRTTLYTIEWETTMPEISRSLEQYQEVLGLDGIKNISHVNELLTIGYKVLNELSKDPKSVPANVPSLLKESLDRVIEFIKGTSLDTIQMALLKDRLQEIFDEISQQDVAAMKIEAAAGAKPFDVSDLTPTYEPSEQIEENFLTEKGKELLKEHIIELQKQVNKIIPLESALAKTPGMEKLLKFQKGIRIALEKEITLIGGFFFSPFELSLPKAPPRTATITRADMGSGAKPQKTCPFKQLATFSLEDVTIGVPPDEIGYLAKPSWSVKGYVKKANTIALNRLKPWPWTNLKGMVQNKLKNLNKKKLAKLEFPVVEKIGKFELKPGKDFYLLILFDGTNGFALKIPEGTVTFNVPDNTPMTDVEGPFEGKIELNGNEIYIITAKSLSQT